MGYKIALLLVFIFLNNLIALGSEDTTRKNNNRFSFGIDYSPLNFSRQFTIYDFSYYDEIILFYGVSSIESNFTISVLPKLRVSTNIIFNKSYSKTHEEEHRDHLTNSYDNGYERTDEMTTLHVSIGGKYYIQKPAPRKLSTYLTFGVGKQFASAIDDYDQLFEEYDPDDPQIEENQIEYLEQLNSPTSLYFGFGPEYFINEIISIVGYYRYESIYIHGKYKYQEIGTDYNNIEFTKNKTREYNQRDVRYRISIGVNFYL